MILLDTHAWLWWVHDADKLSIRQREKIKANEIDCIGVSAISCWEISKLFQYRRIELPLPLLDWFQSALTYPGIKLVELTPAIAAESANLPGEFHKDPADQIIVASARIQECPLVTSDSKIISYQHVITIN